MALSLSRADAPAAQVVDHTRHQTALRLLPFLLILYVTNYLDRTSLAYAAIAYGEKTRPGPEQQLIAQRPSMINEAREVLCQWRFPASLIYVLIVSPSPVPSTFYAASLS